MADVTKMRRMRATMDVRDSTAILRMDIGFHVVLLEG